MASQTEKMVILFDDKGTVKAHTKGVRGAEAATVSMTGAVKKLATGYVVIKALKMGAEMAEHGARAQDVSKAYKNLAKSAGVDATQALIKMKKATAGTIDEFQLMQKFSSAALLGLPLDRFDEMLAIARGASAATGETMEFMLNSIVTALGRGSKLMLDNLGIMIDVGKANADYAQSLGKTARELTDVEKKQAFVNKALELGNANLQKTGDVSELAADSYGRLRASALNLKTAIGKLLEPAVGALADTFSGAADAAIEMIDAASLTRLQSLEKQLKSLKKRYAEAGEGTFVVTAEQIRLWGWIQNVERAIENLNTLAAQVARDNNIKKFTEDARTGVEELTPEINLSSAALGIWKTTFKEDLSEIMTVLGNIPGQFAFFTDQISLIGEAGLAIQQAQLDQQLDAAIKMELERTTTAEESEARIAAIQEKFARRKALLGKKASKEELKRLTDQMAIEIGLATTGVRTEQEKQAAIQNIREDFDQKAKDLAADWKWVKYAQAISDTALAIISAVANTKGGIKIKAAAGIAAGLVGAAQIAAIKAQPYALGTSGTAPGLSLVGERGPELAKFPTGTKIFTNNQTNDILGGAGSIVNNYYNIDIQTQMLDETVIDEIEPRLIAMIERGQSELVMS